MFLQVLKKVHMYAGLFAFTALMVYGISGLIDSSHPAWSERPAPPTTVESIAFETPPNVGDAELGRLIYERLDLPLSSPPRDFNLRRDTEQNLVVTFYTPNGVRTVTVFESEGRLKLVRTHVPLKNFMTAMHGALVRNAGPRLLNKAWGYYNEAGLWALGLMALSGVALWVGSRRNLRWAQAVFAAGNAVLLALVWWMK